MKSTEELQNELRRQERYFIDLQLLFLMYNTEQVDGQWDSPHNKTAELDGLILNFLKKPPFDTLTNEQRIDARNYIFNELNRLSKNLTEKYTSFDGPRTKKIYLYLNDDYKKPEYNGQVSAFFDALNDIIENILHDCTDADGSVVANQASMKIHALMELLTEAKVFQRQPTYDPIKKLCSAITFKKNSYSNARRNDNGKSDCYKIIPTEKKNFRRNGQLDRLLNILQ